MTQQPVPYQSLPPFDRDASHLKTLAICHYVYGGITMAFSCIFIVHIVLGIVMLNNPAMMNNASSASRPPPPEWFGWIFVGAGSCAIVLGWTLGILNIYSGRCIMARRSRTFTLVIAGIDCLSVPLGTTLGVFTFVVLLRDSVRWLYESAKVPPSPL
jgi:hypothetical protein